MDEYNTEFGTEEEQEEKPVKKHRVPLGIRILLGLLLTVVVLVGGALLVVKIYFDRYYNLSNRENPEDITHVNVADLSLEEIPSDIAESLGREIEQGIGFRPDDAPTIILDPYVVPSQNGQDFTLPPELQDTFPPDILGPGWSDMTWPDLTTAPTEVPSGEITEPPYPTDPPQNPTDPPYQPPTNPPQNPTNPPYQPPAPTQPTQPEGTWRPTQAPPTQEWQQPAPTKPAQQTVIYSNQVYNIMLIGADRRDSTWNGNSDSMILLSINYYQRKIVMTSFMRDIVVQVPGYGVRQLNSAFPIGGGPLLLATMHQNFGIYINNYAWVDFDGMEEIIDVLGGVDIAVNPAEAEFLGLEIEESKVIHMNGKLALKYARDRWSGGYDFNRTQHQRNIINAIIYKMRSAGIGDLMKSAETILPYVNHNIDQGVLMELLRNLPDLINFTFVEQRVPYDGLYTYYNGYWLLPDFAATIQRLYSTIY